MTTTAHAEPEHVETGDAGHGHAPHKAAYDDVNIRSIAIVGGVGAVLVFVAVVAVQVIYFRYRATEYDRKVLEAASPANEILVGQQEQLREVGRSAGQDEGETVIPIDEAMRLVVAEYRQRREGEQEAQPTGDAPEGETTEATATE